MRIADGLGVSVSTRVDLEEARDLRELRSEVSRRAKAASGPELRRLLRILDALRT